MSSELESESERERGIKRAKLSNEALEEGPIYCDIDSKHERSEEERLSEQVFSIPLILKEVLKYLDTQDLLRTSLLNKHWNFFSREVLRESKNCLAIVEEENSCRDLKKLNAVLLNSGTVPFNGLSISVPWSDRNHQCTIYADMSELLSNILGRINIKYLSIDCEQGSNCISVECIREIIQEKASSLEGLCLDKLPYLTRSFSEFIGLDLQGPWLPNVRLLEFPYELQEDDMPESVIKELVEASPKLQKLYGNINTECLEFIVPLKLAQAVKEFHFRPTINSLKTCLAFCLENPKLNKFRFSTSEEDDEDGTMFSEWRESCQNDVARIVKQLLISSGECLTKVAFDHLDLIHMTSQWNIPALKQVAHLSFMYSNGIDNREGYDTLRKLEWEKYFPNLKEVCVTNLSFDDMERDFYISDAFREGNSQFVCESVKKFCLTWSMHFVDARQIQMFKTIFPNVKEFYLKQSRQFVALLNELWTAWSDLEAIYMSVDMRPSCSNYDSVILGMRKEEATYLLENVEDLESLQIVSTKPCIFNLRKLKKFVIHFNHNGVPCLGNRSTSDSIFLSRLTGQLAFSRMPGLVVEIDRDLCKAKDNCHLAFNHLKPYVKFVECDDFCVSF
ncbi:unnamed protein product [Allacma fusca]|uniref:F-box domain-containing protein n=1 Tax=Allacma fusca TaxID=39272 RepID=A0A8J2KW85_9HEXA|nr:unnamed protein product [Allacma fusca]